MPALLYLVILGLGWLPVSLLARNQVGIEISPWYYLLGCLALTAGLALSLVTWDRWKIRGQRHRAIGVGIGTDSSEVRDQLGHPLVVSNLDFERKFDRIGITAAALFLYPRRLADIPTFLNLLSGRSSEIPREAKSAWIYGKSFAFLNRGESFWPSYPYRFFLGVPQRPGPDDFVVFFDSDELVCEIRGVTSEDC